MVFPQQVRAVDIPSLAHLYTIGKVPRFAAPIPPVPRPELLTNQLRGCCHCQGTQSASSVPAVVVGSNPAPTLGMIPPDYGTLRSNGNWGLFKMVSSGHGLGSQHYHSGYYATPHDHYVPGGTGGLHGLGSQHFHSGFYATPHDHYVPGGTGGLHGYRSGLAYLGDVATTADIAGASVTDNLPSAGSGNNSILAAVATGVSFIPGIGPIAGPLIASFNKFLNQMESWLGIGAGRREADLIVPVQNQFMGNLGTITNQFLTGMTPTASQLVTMYRDVWMNGVAFQEFVLQKTFTDRRASGQALNSVMPYVDGSCGYDVPAKATAYPSQQRCIQWGSGTIGGNGYDGMLGALARAIGAAGGTVPNYPNLHSAANNGIPGGSGQTQLPGSQLPGVTTITPNVGGTFGTSMSQTIMGIPLSMWLIGAAVLVFMMPEGSSEPSVSSAHYTYRK